MIAKVSKAGVDRPFNIDAGFTSFKYVEISLIVLISDLVLSNFISKPNSILLISELISFNIFINSSFVISNSSEK